MLEKKCFVTYGALISNFHVRTLTIGMTMAHCRYFVFCLSYWVRPIQRRCVEYNKLPPLSVEVAAPLDDPVQYELSKTNSFSRKSFRSYRLQKENNPPEQVLMLQLHHLHLHTVPDIMTSLFTNIFTRRTHGYRAVPGRLLLHFDFH